jgi:hypothetical protein
MRGQGPDAGSGQGADPGFGPPRGMDDDFGQERGRGRSTAGKSATGKVTGRRRRGAEAEPGQLGDSAAKEEPAFEAPPPRRDMWSPYDEGPRSRRPIYIALGGLLLLIAFGVGLAMMANSEPETTAVTEPQSRPAVSVAPQGPGGKDGFAASRTTDKFPLSLKEVFSKEKITKSGRSYQMTIRRSDKSCKEAATGDKLTKALKDAGCNQLLRASYRDKSGKIIGTVGVANLKTSKLATKVVSAAGGGKLEDYVKPLPGKDDTTKALGSGQANAGAWRHGHYAVLLWFQFKDGHTPSAAERKKLNQAAVDITDVTVFPALDSRALTGRRPA